jgi:hypothetical protein
MTVDELAAALRALAEREGKDQSVNHRDADKLLLDYIGSERVAAAFESIRKWYA